MTRAGVILGTAAYMAPEQARGKPIDKRADIWAFGCVLYEMLTARRTFGGDDVTDTLTAVLRDTPDWSALPASTPASIRRLLVRCLERDPKMRLRDIGDARLEIAAAGSDTADQFRPTNIDRRRWIPAALWVALGVAAVATAVGFALRRETPPASVARTTVMPPVDLPLRLDASVQDVLIVPDGSRIIYPSRRSDPEGARVAATQLVVRALGAFEASPLPNLGPNPHQAFASPDGAWIGFATTVGDKVSPVLAKAAVSGGPLTVIDDLSSLGELRGASWTSDGRIVFATSQITTGLMQVPAAGGARVQLTTPDATHDERDHLWPDVLPGNAGTLFTISREAGRFDVAVLPAGETRWRVIVSGGTMPHYLSSGQLVYVADDVLYGVGFDLRSLTVTTQPMALVRGVLVKESGAADYSVAGNGMLVYVAGSYKDVQRRLVWVQVDGTMSALPLDERAYQTAGLSPDGRRIAVLIRERGFGSIWIYDTTRDTFTRLTTKEESVGSPVWSPDSRRLVFWSDLHKGLFTIAVDGSDRSDRLTGSDVGTLYPSAWSPDGATIAFISSAPSLSLLAMLARPPYTVRQLATGPGAQVEGTFSPDGRWLAHISSERGVPEVVVGPAAGGRQWPIAPAGRWPNFDQGPRSVPLCVSGP
jgi:serine/threonine-protein kinase